MNYYSFHIGDYATHTRYLDLLSDLAYRRLLDLYYTSEAPITLDVDKASALIGMREHSEIVSEVLSNFFLKSEDGYRNARCDAEIEVYHAKADRARSANTKRWDSKKAPDSLKSDLKSEQSRIPTNNQEPITNNQYKNKTITPPIGVDELVWNDFVAHRKSKKAPISATALKGIEVEARKANISLQAALEICCARGWTGFKAEWLADKTTSIQSRQEKNMEGLHQLTGGMLRPKKDYSVFPSIVMEESNVQLLGS